MTDKQNKLIPKLRFPEFKNDGGWEFRRLGDIADSFSGGTPTASKADYYGGDIPFIRSGEVNSPKTSLFLTQAGLDCSAAKMVDKGTILYALYGATSGEVGLARVRGAINQAVLAIVPKEGIENLFLFQYLRYAKSSIINRFIQGGQGNLSAAIISNLLIPLPSLAEQRKIAEFLTSLDDLLAGAKAKREQLIVHKKGLMQRLFPTPGRVLPEIRLNGFEHAGEWKVRKLKEIITVNSGKDYKHLRRGDIPVYGTGGYMTSVDEKLSDVDAVGIGRKGTIDKPMFLKAPFWTVDTLFFLTSSGEVDIQFLFYLMQQIPWKKYAEQTGVPSLSKNSIDELEVCIPAISEQLEIASLCYSCDALIKEYDDKISLLCRCKQGLLQVIMC